jgi:integrase
MSTFISNLAGNLDDFISYKNALGIEYKTCRVYLRKLDIYNFEHGNYGSLTKEVVEGWSISHAGKSTSRDRSWIPPIREFGRYLRSMGDDGAYVLDNRFTIQHYRAEVYLMSNVEIRAFFKECDSYVLNAKVPGRPYVFPALYRFLYCCGARCVEARKLKCGDVHLDKGFVDILQTKSHRDRRLYLSDDLTEYLEKYDTAITRCFPDREYFFPGGRGGICSPCAVSVNFRNIWISAGLKRDGRVKPRAYDFRHNFACANIMRWSSEGKDIQAMLTYLMIYMGHSSLESTYYYIHLIPDYFPQYSTLTAATEELIPEVEEYEV